MSPTMIIFLVLLGIGIISILVIIILSFVIKGLVQDNKKLKDAVEGLRANLVSVEGLYNQLQNLNKEKGELHEKINSNDNLSDAASKLRDNKPSRG